MAKTKIKGWFFYSFGGMEFTLEDRVVMGFIVVYTIDELGLEARGMSYKQAAEALLYRLEVALRNEKGDLWDYLRRVNGML